MTIYVTTTEPVVERRANGAVHIAITEGEWLVFRTGEDYGLFREFLDREEMAHDLDAIEVYRRERERIAAGVTG